jgi:hypothetical protein
MRLGRFRVVFGEGVQVIGDASGCLIRWRWTLRERRVGAATGGWQLGGMQPRSWEKYLRISEKLLLSLYILCFLLNRNNIPCLDIIFCNMSHAVLLSFISSHTSLVLFHLVSPIS